MTENSNVMVSDKKKATNFKHHLVHVTFPAGIIRSLPQQIGSATADQM